MLSQFFQDASQTPPWGGVLGMSIREETPGQTWGKIMYLGWHGNALGFPPVELVEVAGDRRVWASFLKLKRPHPRPG